MRARIRYSIKNHVRFISHLDLMRVFFRACIKKNIPVAVSHGYSPHLKLSFGPPLGVGISSSCEYLDIYLEKPVPIKTLKKNLQKGLPEGIRIDEAHEVPPSLPALSVAINSAVYSVKIPAGYRVDIKKRIKEFLEKESVVVERRDKTLNIRPLVNELKSGKDGLMVIDVALGQQGSPRPIEVISSLWPEAEHDEVKLWPVHRKELLGL